MLCSYYNFYSFPQFLARVLWRLSIFGSWYLLKVKFWVVTRGEELPYEEYMGVCHELGSYFQEKIPKRVCQFFKKIPERAIISVRNSR